MTAAFKAPASVLDELGILEPGDINIEDIAQYCGATRAAVGPTAVARGSPDRRVSTKIRAAKSTTPSTTRAHRLAITS